MNKRDSSHTPFRFLSPFYFFFICLILGSSFSNAGTVDEICPCYGPEFGTPWNNHGEYVACVSHAVKKLAETQIILRNERGSLVSNAAQSVCGTNNSVYLQPLTIQAFYDDLSGLADSGVAIFVDGEQVGETTDGGVFTLELPVEKEYEIRALKVGVAGGRETIFITQSTSGSQVLQIVMKGEGGVIEAAPLVIDGLADGIIKNATSLVSMYFADPTGTPMPISVFDYVILQAADETGGFIDIKEHFSLGSDGVVVLSAPQLFYQALSSFASRKIKLSMYAEDDAGLVFSGEQEFYFGQYLLKGKIEAPPSNPGIALGGLPIKAVFLQDENVMLETISYPDGSFEFDGLPLGNWNITTTIESDGFVYNGLATLNLSSDLFVTMILRTINDVLNGVPPFELSGSIAQLAVSFDSESESQYETDRIMAEQRFSLPRTFEKFDDSTAGLVAPLESVEASVFVMSATQNIPVTSSTSLIVPGGTETIILEYNVFSAEYPYWVLQQSPFNDFWSLQVLTGNGAILYSIARQVNSMLSLPPVWQSDGTTGIVRKEIDVSSLTVGGDMEIVISASATNIGDSILATGLEGSIKLSAVELKISEVISDVVVPTFGDSSYYSIPRSGDRNANARKYTLKISKPDNMIITNVKALLMGINGATEWMTVVDEPPGVLATEIDDETLEVKITMGSENPSTVDSTPPPVHSIRHKFFVEGSLGGQTYSDEKESAPRKALWILPDSIARKCCRDDGGGDSWTAKGAYEWLSANSSLVPPVDDVSGEHARDIGHPQGHQTGIDMDTYHFTNLSATGELTTGAQNYQTFASETVAALEGDEAAITRVRGWISDSRTGLSSLAAQSAVRILIYHRGVGTAILPSGWAQSLMETGRLIDNQNRVLDLGLGSWSSSKVRMRNDHNSHLHIGLENSALSNSP